MVRVAAFQTTPKENVKARKAQIYEALIKADAFKIDFVCFPEGCLTGYYEDKHTAWKHSIDTNSKDFQNWINELKHFNVTSIIGFVEREGNNLFDSAIIIEQGKLLGIQRKHYLYHDYFTSHEVFSCYTSKGITFGVTICLDANYFEPSRLLALQGASILFCPMCNKVPANHPFTERPSYYSQFIARSHENRCWIIGADWSSSDEEKFICPGHSVIYDPDGLEVARSREGKEELLVIEIPKDRLFHEKGSRVHGSPLLSKKLAGLWHK
jgi:predicted amidohydrolase